MTALAAGRLTDQLLVGDLRNSPQKGSTTLFQGGIVCLNASGYALPASASAVLIAAGVARSNDGLDRWANTGADGASTVDYDEGVFGFANSAGGDAITIADVGKPCWLVDDQTVAKTSGVGARSPAGRVFDVQGAVVFVHISKEISRSILEDDSEIIALPVTLVAHTEGSIAARFTPGYAGRIAKITESVDQVVTTGSKAATATPAIAGTPTTGGAVALTSANQTPVGAKVDGSAITAADIFSATQEITIVMTSVTAFAEGRGIFYLFLKRFQ